MSARPAYASRATRRWRRAERITRSATASVGVALAALALVPVPAEAVAPTVVTTANFVYLPGEVVMLQGGSVTLANLEHASHDVTADETGPTGQPRFGSESIGQGTTPVLGVEDLEPGVYTFFCTVHPEMVGLLNVKPIPPV